MENVKKLTKRDLFGQARELAVANGREDSVAFIDHEIDLLNKKEHQALLKQSLLLYSSITSFNSSDFLILLE